MEPVQILLLDGSTAFRKVLRRLLEKDAPRPYVFTECDTGRQGMEAYQKGWRTGEVDCVLLGDGLADYPGTEMLRRIRRLDNLAVLPVLYFTGRGDGDEGMEALRLGARDCFEKGGFRTVDLHLAIGRCREIIDLYRENLAQRELLARHVLELETAREEVERSNRELSAYTYTISHDLKEPLRKVQQFGRLLEDKLGNSMDEEGQFLLSRMTDGAARMGGMLDALLEYSRVGRMHEAEEWLDLSQVLAEVVDDLDLVLKESGGRVESDALPTVFAPRIRMRQLLQNLVGNAIKYRKEGVPPVVRVTPGPPGGDLIQFSIQDNGIGFEPEQSEKIFGLFQRLHGRDSQYQGSGVGLATCRKIVESLGGSIHATGVPGQGSCFIVELPMRERVPREEGKPG